VKRVFSPWFEKYEKYNNQAKSKWESYGYEVIFIHGLEAGAHLGGGLRCMVATTGKKLPANYWEMVENPGFKIKKYLNTERLNITPKGEE
jgi:hypothetical protein